MMNVEARAGHHCRMTSTTVNNVRMESHFVILCFCYFVFLCVFPQGMLTDGKYNDNIRMEMSFRNTRILYSVFAGNAYLAVRDYITAISCFDLALKTHPGSDQEDVFLSNRATAHFRTGTVCPGLQQLQ